MAPGQDALSEALEELKFRCAPFETTDAPQPWRRDFPLDAVSIHVPLEGACHIAVDTPIWTHHLDRGEILVVNRGLGGALLPRSGDEPPQVISARVEFEAPHGHPLLSGLPDLIQASPGGGPLPRTFEPLLDAFLAEADRPRVGSGTIALRFLEALFVQALRCHLLDVNWNDRGWFRVLADPVLRSWPGPGTSDAGSVATITDLATSVTRSPRRSSARFRELAGFTHSDLAQQTRARRAARLLREGETDLARIAHVTGYGSRPSFCRAFKRELGVSPAAYWRGVHKRPFPRQPEGPEKTQWEAEAEYGCPDMWELRFTLEEEAEGDGPGSAERAHPSEPE
jgi:AraC-like DNA-binding protein